MLERFDGDPPAGSPGRRNAAWRAFDEHHKLQYARAAVRLHEWGLDSPVILDAACGTGYGRDVLKHLGHYLGVDRCPVTVRACELRHPVAVGIGGNGDGPLRARYQVLDIEDPGTLTLANLGPVDVVVSIATAEHLHDPALFLQRLHHLLAPRQGRLIFSAPTGLTRDVDPFHRHDVTAQGWSEMLGRAGFIVEHFSEDRFEVPIFDLLRMVPTTLRQKLRVAGFIVARRRYLVDRVWHWGVRRRFVWTSCFAVCRTT